jgi:hypothetical protein
MGEFEKLIEAAKRGAVEDVRAIVHDHAVAVISLSEAIMLSPFVLEDSLVQVSGDTNVVGVHDVSGVTALVCGGHATARGYLCAVMKRQPQILRLRRSKSRPAPLRMTNLWVMK